MSPLFPTTAGPATPAEVSEGEDTRGAKVGDKTADVTQAYRGPAKCSFFWQTTRVFEIGTETKQAFWPRVSRSISAGKSPCGGPFAFYRAFAQPRYPTPTFGISQTHHEYLLAEASRLELSLWWTVAYYRVLVNLDILHRPSVFPITGPELP
ncbi:hypothetical protein AVEN_5502-1 [Araneus ventricosus]|uniref:Uncharacterized protein n=1 Tax=Araneus ventricosus TaxID=182803 RepID=A0A4Y2JNT0_ARAVE|nr:hypothetical protein AVEN_5502-1 [Araneus ventricosus]